MRRRCSRWHAGSTLTPDALALACVLAQPWVDVVLSGASTVAMLQSNLTALGLEVGGDTVERLAPLAEDPETYWEERSQLAWT